MVVMKNFNKIGKHIYLHFKSKKSKMQNYSDHMIHVWKKQIKNIQKE